MGDYKVYVETYRKLIQNYTERMKIGLKNLIKIMLSEKDQDNKKI